MERLTTLLAFTVLLSVCNLAGGQTVTFTVAGDVANPRTLALHGACASQAVFLNDLLEHAGIQSDGSAVIIRGESLQPIGSEWVSANTAGRGSKLEDGDIVIFRGVPGSSSRYRHIIVVAGSTRGVAQLADTGSHLGNLLASLGIDASVGIEIPIIRTHEGSAVRRSAGPRDLLVHGDVILLDGSGMLSTVALGRVTELFDQIAEQEMPLPSSSPIQTVSDQRRGTTSLGVRDSDSLMLPAVESKDDEPPVASSHVPVIQAAVESIASPENGRKTPAKNSLVPDGNLLANHREAASVSPLWNGVFVFGLIGSIALILTGWLKTHRSNAKLGPQDAETLSNLQPPREISDPTGSIASSWAAGDKVQSHILTSEISTLPEFRQEVSEQPTEAVSAVETSTVVPVPLPTDSTTLYSDRLVEEQEWFGANWRSSGVDRSELDLCGPVQELTSTPVDASDCHLNTGSVADHSSRTKAESEFATADDFEELLQNRLAVELQQASFPFRVTLFGRPAGPRRLRIDAAHSQIEAPRYSMGSRSRRVSSQKATPESVDQDRLDAASLDRALNSLHEQGHS